MSDLLSLIKEFSKLDECSVTFCQYGYEVYSAYNDDMIQVYTDEQLTSVLSTYIAVHSGDKAVLLNKALELAEELQSTLKSWGKNMDKHAS